MNGLPLAPLLWLALAAGAASPAAGQTALPAPVPIEGGEEDRLENLGLQETPEAPEEPEAGEAEAANGEGAGEGAESGEESEEGPPGDAAQEGGAPAEDDWGEVEDIEEAGEEAMESYDQESTWYGDANPVFDRHLNLMTARAARPFSFIFAVSHRTNTPFVTRPFENWLGFDGGALKVLLALRYGIWDNFDVGIARLNGTVEDFDTYELDGRYQFLQQDDHFVDLALRLGGSWFHSRTDDALKPFGQILVDRVFFNRLMLSLGLMIHGDSSTPKTTTDTNWSMAGSVAADVRIFEFLAFSAELSFAFAGYVGPYPSFTFGPKLITNRHTFALVLSNTQYVTADGVVANTPVEIQDMILGFTITREMEL